MNSRILKRRKTKFWGVTTNWKLPMVLELKRESVEVPGYRNKIEINAMTNSFKIYFYS